MTRFVKCTACAIGAGAALAVFGATRGRARRKKLDGQVVLITGGSRGLGLAMACEFGDLECRIAICARDGNELKRARETLALTGCEVFTVVCDISDRNGVTAMMDKVTRHHGRIDILVNYAREIAVSQLENLELEDFERAIGGKVSVPHLLSYSRAKAAAVAFSDGLRNEIRQFGIWVREIEPKKLHGLAPQPAFPCWP